MFTGIIEELGVIKRINQKGHTLTLMIQAKDIMKDLHVGDSISVNGVCLTVTGFSKDQFEVDVMPETFKHTSLTSLKEGSKSKFRKSHVCKWTIWRTLCHRSH